MSISNFNVWQPVDFKKGGVGKSGGRLMKGVASTPSEDLDGERLDPNGYELDFFIKGGFMNWDHQTASDPMAYIGRPTENTRVEDDALHIEFELFKDHPKADKVIDLADVLSKNGLQLGLSIEGKALEYADETKKHITKALVTGCAITPHPRNRDTFVELVKGLISDSNDEDNLSEFFKGYDSKPMIKKGEEAEEEEEETEETEEVEKAMSAGSTSGAAVSKESLQKDLIKPEEEDSISKGAFFVEIGKRYPTMTLEQAEGLFEKAKQLENKKSV